MNSSRPAKPVATPPNGIDTKARPASESEPAATVCPNCGSTLTDPTGLGWCRACGYCKSLEEDEAGRVLEKKPSSGKASPFGVIEFFQILARLPSWPWMLVAGVCVVFAMSMVLSGSLADKPFQRAVCSTVEMVLGMLLILLGQTWALCVLAPHDDRLHFKDAIVPGRLWGMTLKKLPRTQGQVWLLTWGLACILASVLIIGGQTYWLNHLPQKPAPPPVVEEDD